MLTHSAPITLSGVLIFVQSVADPVCTRVLFSSFNGRSRLQAFQIGGCKTFSDWFKYREFPNSFKYKPMRNDFTVLFIFFRHLKVQG